LCILISPAGADDYLWGWQAQHASWHAKKRINPPDPELYINNFGVIGNPPGFPGGGDNVTVGAPHPTYGDPTIYQADVSINDLDVTGYLQVEGNRTLTVGGDLNVSGEFRPFGSALTDSLTNVHGAIDNTGVIDAYQGGVVAYYGTSIRNDGTIRLRANTGMGGSELQILGDTLLTGSGTFECGDLLTGTHTLTNAAGHTINYGIKRGGEGLIHVALVNDGLLNSSVTYRTLSLRSADKTNNGVMKATYGGYLDIYCTVNQSPGGQIAADGGTVRLRGGTITGGLLDCSGSSRFETVSGTTNTISDLVNDGFIDVLRNNSTLVLNGSTITNNGTMKLNANTGMGSGRMRIDADIVLDGTGQLQCGDRLYSNTGNTLTNAAGHTISYGPDRSGEGKIEVALINNGVVNSNADGQIVRLSSAAKTNNSMMKATNNGYLDIYSTVNQSPGGQIVANSGTVRLRGATITGGLLDCTGESRFETAGGTTNTIADLVNDGFVNVLRNNSTLVLGGSTITNNGTIRLNANTGMGAGQMRIDADVVLDGSGELQCGDRIYSDTGNTLTNAAGHTINYGLDRSGEGRVEVALINNGMLDSGTPHYTIGLSAAAKTNNGVMQATNSGFLDIFTTINQGPGGSILADGGTVRLRGGGIFGGTVDSGGGKMIEGCRNTDTTLRDAVNNGYIMMWSNGCNLLVKGTMTNNGTIQLKPNTGMGHGRIRLDEDAVIGGTGQVLCNSEIYSNTANRLTNLAGHTIKGRGGVKVPLSNLGVVESDQAGRTLRLWNGADQFAGGTLTGGTWIARAGATLQVDGVGDVTTNQGTVLLDGIGSTFARINPLADNQGSFAIDNSRNFATVSNLTSSGTVSVGAASTLTVNGDYTPTAGSQTNIAGGLAVTGDVLLCRPPSVGTCEVTLTSGSLDVGGTLQLWPGGELNLEGGSVTADTFDYSNGGTFNFTGGELHVETFLGDLVDDGGAICPGSSPGVTSVLGDAAINSGLLNVDIGGLVRGDDYDALTVTGEFTPGGTLQVELIGSFDPEEGDTFDILDWGTLSAMTFDEIELPDLTGTKFWDTSDLYTTGQLGVIGRLIGDTNGDGDVDAGDYNKLLSSFGTDNPNCDFNEDGIVDFTDFALQRAHYGQSVPLTPAADLPGGTAITTPEPTSAVLLLAGLGFVVHRKRRTG